VRTIQELFNLDGRVAVITGGAGELGTQMAYALAEAGAHLVLCSRDVDKCKQRAEEISTGHNEAIGLRCDVTDPAEIKTMVGQVMQKWGKIDILVNNTAGGKGWFGPGAFEKLSLEDWNYSIAATMTSQFLCTQAIGPVMVEQQKGSIVNIGSIYGMVSADQRIYGDTHYNSPVWYAAAKGGVANFTRFVATYWANYGVRCNCICPGGFGTKGHLPYFHEKYCHKAPLDRMGNDEDLKGAVVYLASDASAFVTGHILMVDGGWTIW